MNMQEIKELNRAIVELHKFCNGGAIRTKQGDIDKYGTGFNVDGRSNLEKMIDKNPALGILVDALALQPMNA